MKESFVILQTDRKRRCDLRELYPGLQDAITGTSRSAGEERIKVSSSNLSVSKSHDSIADGHAQALAMNLTNPKCFAVAWRNGAVFCNSDGAFDDFVFQEFATKNFGT